MLTFAFLTLVLAMYTVAGVFVYRYAKQEFKTALNQIARRQVVRNKQFSAAINSLAARAQQAEASIKQLLAQPNNKNLALLPTANFRENMEERFIRENPKVVAVDGVQKSI